MIRITGGEYRGRKLTTPHSAETRPTQAKLRQAILNSLQAVWPDARVLDLFAGSGAFGFETLSRGAQNVVFVEQSKPALQCIEKNAEILRVADRIQILGHSVDRVWKELEKKGPFDVVFADPPYEANWETKLLSEIAWEKLLVPDGYFCLEWGAVKSVVKELPEEVSCLRKVREKNYGDSVLTTYVRSVLEKSE